MWNRPRRTTAKPGRPLERGGFDEAGVDDESAFASFGQGVGPGYGTSPVINVVVPVAYSPVGNKDDKQSADTYPIPDRDRVYASDDPAPEKSQARDRGRHIARHIKAGVCEARYYENQQNRERGRE
jgi:hypothetical protein